MNKVQSTQNINIVRFPQVTECCGHRWRTEHSHVTGRLREQRSKCAVDTGSCSSAMEQRLYGVNTATLHHYPTQHLPSAYPGLHQSFQNPRHPHFPSMYPPRQGFSGGLAYGGQQDWTFSGAASAGLGPLGGMNTGLHGGAACGVFGARPESGDYLYPSQGAGSGPSMQLAGPMSHPRALVSGGTQYCDSSVYPSSYSPDHCHPYPPSPSQSLSSSPSSTDSSDKLHGAGEFTLPQSPVSPTV